MSPHSPSITPLYERVLAGLTGVNRYPVDLEFHLDDALFVSFETGILLNQRYRGADLPTEWYADVPSDPLRRVQHIATGSRAGAVWMIGMTKLAVARSDDGGRPLDTIALLRLEETDIPLSQGKTDSPLRDVAGLLLCEDSLVAAQYTPLPSGDEETTDILNLYWSLEGEKNTAIVPYPKSPCQVERVLRGFTAHEFPVPDFRRVLPLAEMVHYLSTVFQARRMN